MMTTLAEEYPDIALETLQAVEKSVRSLVVSELRSSAFMVCDVNKEDLLLCIKHGTCLIEARRLEGIESGRRHHG